MNITQSECVFVALGIQYTGRHIVVCGLPRSKTFFSYYLINGTIFGGGGGEVIEHKTCSFFVLFSLLLLSETLFIPRRIERK